MEWIEVENQSSFGGKPSGWRQYPAVSITANGLSLNQPLVDQFGATEGKSVRVCIGRDSTRRAIGLKVLSESDDIYGAYRIQGSHNKNQKTRNCHVTCKNVVNQIMDCVKHVYRAHLNPTGKLIEVDLSPENMLK